MNLLGGLSDNTTGRWRAEGHPADTQGAASVENGLGCSTGDANIHTDTLQSPGLLAYRTQAGAVPDRNAVRAVLLEKLQAGPNPMWPIATYLDKGQWSGC